MTKLTANKNDLLLVDAIVNKTGRAQRTAYNALFNKYYPRMLRFIKGRYRLLREDEVQDAAIEGLTKAFRVKTLTDYKPTHNFSTWVYKVIDNKVHDILRKEKKWDTQYIDDLSPEDSSVEFSIDYMTPDRSLFNEETFDLIKFCIGKLSDAQRNIVQLSLIEELNDKEIISRIWGNNLSEVEIVSKANTVRATVHRGKKALQNLLENEGVTA